MFQLPVSVLAYDNEGCQDHQFLLLKHKDHCLVTVSCKSLTKALKWSKLTKDRIILKVGDPSKSASSSDVLQQTIKLK